MYLKYVFKVHKCILYFKYCCQNTKHIVRIGYTVGRWEWDALPVITSRLALRGKLACYNSSTVLYVGSSDLLLICGWPQCDSYECKYLCMPLPLEMFM